jgi:hypothetical protein
VVPVKRRASRADAADSRSINFDWSLHDSFTYLHTCSASSFAAHLRTVRTPDPWRAAAHAHQWQRGARGLPEDAVMFYRHCPRCRLAIRCRATYLALDHCPRCLGRAGILTTMFSSTLNAVELRAAETEGDHPVSVRAPQQAAGPRAVQPPSGR